MNVERKDGHLMDSLKKLVDYIPDKLRRRKKGVCVWGGVV